MRRSIAFLASLLSVPLPSAAALSVALSGAITSAPFEITVPSELVSSTDLVLTVLNETDSTLTVLLWQLDMQLLPRAGATGSLLFQSAMTAPNSLFGQDPGPTSNLSEPNPHVLAMDIDSVMFTGQPVHPDMPRNILKLNLAAEANTSGFFELVTPEFNPANPDRGSSWGDPEGAEPKPFANSARSDDPEFILLGTIHVTPPGPPVPGDYNMDGVVDIADYHRWRGAFGTSATPAGSGADGNGNALIDAADYVVWRNATTSAATALDARSPVTIPEPPTCIGLILALAFTIRRTDRAIV